jgi:SAM-dependent methyltransferase
MDAIHAREGRVSAFARRLRDKLAAALGPQPEWLQKKQQVDRAFDQAHGVDTGGVTHLKRLRLAGDPRDSVPHIASDPDEFDSALAALPVDPARFTFVDLGAGKGRALLLAARRGFRRIVGVVFAREVVDVAQGNLRAARLPEGVDARVIEQDATTYELPQEPLVLFMYNPFGGQTMQAVARRTRAALERHPRPLHVLYLNPFHLEGWIAEGFAVDRREHFAILTLPQPPSS